MRRILLTFTRLWVFWRSNVFPIKKVDVTLLVLWRGPWWQPHNDSCLVFAFKTFLKLFYLRFWLIRTLQSWGQSDLWFQQDNFQSLSSRACRCHKKGRHFSEGRSPWDRKALVEAGGSHHMKALLIVLEFSSNALWDGTQRYGHSNQGIARRFVELFGSGTCYLYQGSIYRWCVKSWLWVGLSSILKDSFLEYTKIRM